MSVLSSNGKKQLVIERLQWLPNKRCFIKLTFFETFGDTPNSPQSFKFLEQRVHEIAGEAGIISPWYQVWV